MVQWRGQRHALEVELRRDTETEDDALEQLWRDLDHAGLDEGWLVMLDLRSTLPWEERLQTQALEYRGKQVQILRC